MADEDVGHPRLRHHALGSPRIRAASSSCTTCPAARCLIGAENGWFHFDPAAGRVTPAGGAEANLPVQVMHDLPGGAVLIAAWSGWFRFDPAARRVMSAGQK
jgi:hypothetical protein